MNLDKIILGHNQFFGTNHMSSERGAEKANYFSDINNVMKIIKIAYDNGATGLMLSTHENSKQIAKMIEKDKFLKDNLNIHILLPYMAKYVRKSNERGLVNMIADIFKDANWGERFSFMKSGGLSLFSNDLSSMIKTLIDIELLPYKNLNITSIFLHNALTDLISGLKMQIMVDLFVNHVSERYKISPGFCTLNSAELMVFLDEIGYDHPLLMAPFNAAGFQMNPSKNKAEEILKKIPSNMVAMSTLAAGFLKPKIAFEYISSLPEIKSVVVGASSKKHIEQTFNYIQ